MYIMQTDTTPDIFTSGAHAVKRLALYPGGIHKNDKMSSLQLIQA